jgi:hypothetical protein
MFMLLREVVASTVLDAPEAEWYVKDQKPEPCGIKCSVIFCLLSSGGFLYFLCVVVLSGSQDVSYEELCKSSVDDDYSICHNAKDCLTDKAGELSQSLSWWANVCNECTTNGNISTTNEYMCNKVDTDQWLAQTNISCAAALGFMVFLSLCQVIYKALLFNKKISITQTSLVPLFFPDPHQGTVNPVALSVAIPVY